MLTINIRGDKKRVFHNFIYLYLVRVANYILPLITIPYLVRVLGPDKYGLLAFVQAFIQYFLILTDYGFSSSATREISIHRADAQKVSKIFSSVMVIKFVFMAASFVILSLVILCFDKFRANWLVYLYTFGIVLGNVLFPVWFFQGMEKMKYITFRNIIAKSIFTLSIFIFIKRSSDYIYVPLITSAGFLITGVFSIVSIFRDFNVKFILPSMEELKYQLKEGWYIFISGVSISFYTTTNTFVLGLFTTDTIVGYYAAAEKIIRILIDSFVPFFEALYPFISKVAMESKQRALRILTKISLLSLSIYSFIFLIIFFFAKNIVFIILGKKFIESIIIVRILSPLIIVIPIAYIFSNLALLPFKLDKYFARIYITGGILNIFLLFLFLYLLKLNALGAAMANLITEMSLVSIMYFVLRKHNIRIIL
jgi:PST family polysaccharide transporter